MLSVSQTIGTEAEQTSPESQSPPQTAPQCAVQALNEPTILLFHPEHRFPTRYAITRVLPHSGWAVKHPLNQLN